MNEKIKLFLDEDVHSELSVILRKMGFDIVSTVEINRRGKTDFEQIKFAISEKRVILTFNVKDFVLLYNKLYSEKVNHFGIIVSSQINLKETLRRWLKLLNHKSSKEMKNAIEFLNNWK